MSELVYCKFCGQNKKIDFFSKTTLVWKNPKCKECIKLYNKAYYGPHYAKNKDKIHQKNKVYREENKELIKEQHRQDHIKHKPNRNRKSKLHYINNPEYYAEYREGHKEDKKAYNNEYYLLNKNEIIDQHSEYMCKRKKNDPIFRLRTYVSAAIHKSLKSGKNGSIMIYLPYSIEELKLYIESQFEPWMNWNNQGVYKASEWKDKNQTTWKWQVDHIIPQSDLPYDSMDNPNFQRCWALSNLRPLSAKQNNEDGVKHTRHKGNK